MNVCQLLKDNKRTGRTGKINKQKFTLVCVLEGGGGRGEWQLKEIDVEIIEGIGLHFITGNATREEDVKTKNVSSSILAQFSSSLFKCVV